MVLYVVQLNICCHLQKPSVSNNFDGLKIKPSFALIQSHSRLLRDSQKTRMQGDIQKTVKAKCFERVDAFVKSVFRFSDQLLLPSQSNFGPVDELKEAVTITTSCIQGSIPNKFPEGVYIRNGPNPLYGGLKSTCSIFGETSHAWFEGEGMLHALYLRRDTRDGSWIVSYNNRYVENETYKLEKRLKTPSFLPAVEGDSLAVVAANLLNLLRFGKVNKDLSNTSVFEHAGSLYSVAEIHSAQKIDIFTLEYLGDWNLDGKWSRPFTSHPKRAPDSGELVIMGVNATKPFLEVGVISDDGTKLVHKTDAKLDRCTICHDIGVTQRYNVILDFPLSLDLNQLISGGSLVTYKKEGYARIGVMPRYGDADSIRWFGVKSNCTLHILNCYEDADEVVVRGCRANVSIVAAPDLGSNRFEWFSTRLKPIESRVEEEESFFSRVYEWRLNLKTEQVNEKHLTGTEYSMDFPMINGNFAGLKNKYGYTQTIDSVASSTSGMPKFGGLAKLYFEDQQNSKGASEDLIRVEYHQFEENTFCSGSAFVAKDGGTEEDEGWIIAYVHNEATNISQAYIIDSEDFTSRPVAKIELPSRVPYGFHGAFVSFSAMSQPTTVGEPTSSMSQP